jgi:hypothetical protein
VKGDAPIDVKRVRAENFVRGLPGRSVYVFVSRARANTKSRRIWQRLVGHVRAPLVDHSAATGSAVCSTSTTRSPHKPDAPAVTEPRRAPVSSTIAGGGVRGPVGTAAFGCQSASNARHVQVGITARCQIRRNLVFARARETEIAPRNERIDPEIRLTEFSAPTRPVG